MRRKRHLKRAFKRPVDLMTDRNGGMAIEFGLLAPVLFMLLFGIIEGGRLLWTMSALHYSVQEAARCASINTTTCGTASQIQAFAAARAGVGFSASVFSATIDGCGNKITATKAMTLNIPFAHQSVTLTAQSCYPI